MICAILRRGEVVIPRGNVRLEAGDDVLALVDDASAPSSRRSSARRAAPRSPR